MEKILNVQKVSEYLDVKRSTIRSWVFKDKIPHFRIGRLVRFRLSELERWIDEGRHDGPKNGARLMRDGRPSPRDREREADDR